MHSIYIEHVRAKALAMTNLASCIMHVHNISISKCTVCNNAAAMQVSISCRRNTSLEVDKCDVCAT